MMSLLDLITQNQPHFQTHQALVILGLQNDFLQPDGKLPVNKTTGFLDHIETLIPKFRQLSANIIWIQTVYETDRLAGDPTTGEGDSVLVGPSDGVESGSDDEYDLPKDLILPAQSRSSKHRQRAFDLLKRVSARRRTASRGEILSAVDEDEELFLRRSSKNGPACLPNTPGADFVDMVKPKIEPSDTVVRTSNYSAFQGTSLLLILRAKLVTELYICGCITNVSVLATVVDAARHGIKINVVEDCLGFRKQVRHEVALKRMVDLFDANVVASADILNQDRPGDVPQPTSQNGSEDTDDKLERLVNELRLGDRGPTRQPKGHAMPRQRVESPAIALNGRQRTLSDASLAESRTTTDTRLSDDQFAERLSQGSRGPPAEHNKPPTAKQNLVKSKVRMRSRTDRTRRDDVSKNARPDSSQKGEPSSSSRATPAVTDSEPPRPSPRAAAKTPRSGALAKAESSDKLRDTPPRRQQSLKSFASQPSLSSVGVEGGEKSSSPRVRLALSRSPKSDLHKSLPGPAHPSKSPANPTPKASSILATPPPAAQPPAMSKKLQSLANLPVLGPGDDIAEGDSYIIYDFFPPNLRHPTDPSKPLKELIFHQLYNEVRWQKMLHQQGEVPRLVCCQGDFGADGSMPVYRHPTDQTMPLLHFSPKVKLIQKRAEKLAGHPLNHVLIQLYRSGQDFISEHSDKTLDIVRGSSVVNVSFGAQRTMRLRTKKPGSAEDAEEAGLRETQRVAMPHNSMFVLGLDSNEKWLHGIMADKRMQSERSEAELAYSGIRISLTFRQIGTFIDADSSVIWGQGATAKEHRDAQDVINDDEDETERILQAFSRENHSTKFDWDEWYGEGFDVLHLHEPPEDLPVLFASNNHVENYMVQVFLWESKMNYTLVEAPSLEKQYELDRQVCYRDNDVNHTEVLIAIPILLYLDHYHPVDRDDRGRASSSRSYEMFVMVSAMLKYWVNRHVPTYRNDFVNMLESLEERYALSPGPFIAGRRFSIGDCSTWPALDEMISEWDEWTEDRFPRLTEYYRMLWKKKKAIQKLRPELPIIKQCSPGKE
ncbi:hypothetical protein BDV95DRAFT_488072 [Massariosphaeria phaeospora]|uniref:Fe2OG dioxygenase domain-containing protein n=1 Tax=Massariosphaeria phaeospora TaxID=100035 RepID=A0A7C8M9D6_9PLEO|nr:hypothetical protein BDV95DRAFT_488072 [Massariosphaeria phaeospora]